MRRYQRTTTPTPQIITYLIYLQIALSGIWMIARTLFPNFSFYYLQHFFALTLLGVKNFFLWQYLTYFLTEFIIPQAIIGDAFVYAVKLYMFWIAGIIIAERKSIKSFLSFYLSMGILGGIATAMSLLYWSIPIAYMNCFGVIVGMFIAALMLSPDARIYLFNAFPMQLKTIVVVILVFSLLQNISNGNIPNTVNISSIAILSYLYCIFFWQCRGPFRSLHSMEDRLRSWKRKH